MTIDTKSNRIAFVINSLTAGGAEHVLIELLENLKGRLKNHSVHLVLLDFETELQPVPPWVKKHVLNCQFSFVRSVVSLIRFLRDLRPAITVSFLNRANCANVISSKILKHPCIISERTHPTSRFEAGLSALLAKAIMRLTYPRADAVVAVSQGVRDNLIKSLGVDRLRTYVIYNPVDTDRIHARALEAPSITVPTPSGWGRQVKHRPIIRSNSGL